MVSKPVLLLIFAMLCWALNTVLGQLAVGQVSPITVVFLRWAMVTAFVWPLFGSRVLADWPVIRPRLPMIALMAALGFTGFNTLFYLAAHTTSAVNVGILQGSMPVFVLLGAFFAFGTRIRPVQLVGAALGLAGVIMIATKGRPLGLLDLDVNPGDAIMLLACALYAFYTLALKKRPAISGLSFFTLMAPIAMVTAMPLLVAEIALKGIQWPSLQGWIVTLMIAIFPSFLAQLAFLRGVDAIGPGPAGVFMNLVPVFSAVMGVVFLGEQFRTFHAIGLTLVIAGIWLVQRQNARASA